MKRTASIEVESNISAKRRVSSGLDEVDDDDSGSSHINKTSSNVRAGDGQGGRERQQDKSTVLRHAVLVGKDDEDDDDEDNTAGVGGGVAIGVSSVTAAVAFAGRGVSNNGDDCDDARDRIAVVLKSASNVSAEDNDEDIDESNNDDGISTAGRCYGPQQECLNNDEDDTKQPQHGEPPSSSARCGRLPSASSSSSSSFDDRTSKDYYFDSYAHHAIHEEMLKDEVRTRTYEMAIMQNKHLFQDKIVLDVGCGTAILAMFAAQAGAKHIYAVDCSSIIEQARLIIEKNGFADKITLIKGKVEEIELPVKQVDIIVSEWMGYFLLYESMLDTVLYARDKWLVPNGIVFPDKAVMYLTAVEDGNVKRDRFDFWDDVYGFDMTAIKDIAIKEPVVDVVDAKALVTDSVPILHLDILTCTKEDLEFSSKFTLQAQRNDYIHGLVAYFECAFTQIHKPIGFSTAPFARYTHWKQTIFYLEDTLTICAGETVNGEITCTPNKRNRRDLDIGLMLQFKGRHSEVDQKHARYRLR